MAKRNNGEGSITQRKDGTWMGRIMLGRKADGKPNNKCVYGKTKKEVLEKLHSIIHERNNSSNIITQEKNFKDWINYWLKDVKKLKLKPKTYEVYERFIKLHIIPVLEKYILKDINSMILQKMVNSKFSSGLSSASVRKMFNIINQALYHAYNNDLIAKNPCKTIELPKHTQKQIKVFTVEEQNKFFEESKKDVLYPLFVLAVDTGLRLGEILALRWSDIDLDNALVSVSKNIITVKADEEDEARTKNIIKLQDTPKTKSSIRKVPLTQRTLTLLKSLKHASSSILVFATSTGNYLFPRNVERSFSRIVKRAEIESCGFHTLRHVFATRLFELGIPVKIVSEFLGHSKVSHTLDIYTHVIPTLKSESIKVLDEFYKTPKIINLDTDKNEKIKNF